MSDYKLSRCPFCESTNAALVEFRCGDVWVECQDCGAVGPTANVALEMPDRKAEAIALWSKRPVEDALLAACEAALATLEHHYSSLYSNPGGEVRIYTQLRDAIAKAKGAE